MGLFAKDKTSAAPETGERGGGETSFFGAKLMVKGKVSGGGNLIVMGKLEGEFDLNGELVVAASALVNGEAKTVSVTVSGGFSGSLTAKQRIQLEKGAVVSGRLQAPNLSVADGAVLNGEIEMKQPSEGKPAAGDPARKQKK
jgi:cytoskeletal protein CcmA (bactofilin family)